MVLAELTDPTAVNKAMDEFDQIGRDTFLRKYGFGRSRNYFVERNGNLYDSKAIVGVAHGIEHPDRGPLRPEEFIGGDATVRPKLEELGFVVRARDPEPSEPFSEILRRVLELQPSYNKSNTPEMQLRGRLVKQDGPRALRPLVSAIPGLSFEPDVEAGDGTSSKARVPWILIFDRQRYERSPLRWYIAYLFAADGSAAYLSVHLSSARSEDGKYRALPTAFRQECVSWARKHLQLDWEVQQIALHDPGGLGPFFEQGSVIAFRYEREGIPDDEKLRVDLGAMLEKLDVIYQNEDSVPKPPEDGETPVLASAPKPPQDGETPVLGWEALQRETLWTDADLAEVVEALGGSSHQIVLAGPPGTGKTRVARAIARYLTDDTPSRWRLVQLHPSYGYEEFVEGLRPGSESGAPIFEVRPGIVKSIVEAMDTDDRPFVLVIDEMNRANLPRVFGELMYLLEYRDEPIDLQYSRGFRLPSNLLFIGTMNTADRSIRSIDIALRRRFQIFDCPPDVRILERYYEANRTNHVPDLFTGFVRLNEELQEYLDKHHSIGHTFFMANEMTAERLRSVWKRQIGPLIEEYFFDQPDIGSEFVPERFWPAV